MITANPHDTGSKRRFGHKPKRVGADEPPKSTTGEEGHSQPVRPNQAPGNSAGPSSPGRELQRPEDRMVGQTIGRCRIEKLIGIGRTARVYRARHEARDGYVAVKILRDSVAMNESLVGRFQSEARAIAAVDNENVLKIYDVGTQDGRHYMVVELLEGEAVLALILREGQIDVVDALRIIRQAANGLMAAHERKLVHRDVKPENLFLLDDGTVKVLDFGLATGFDKDSERVGTPHYMAPEVCESGAVGPGNDIYGLGISLFQLLTGRPPYAGRDLKGILSAHKAGLPLHPERRRRGVPKDVANLVRHLTKRDPTLRPTAAEVVEALERIGGKELRQKSGLARRRGRSRTRLAVARRERAGKQSLAVAGIAVLLVALVAVFLALGTGGDGLSERDSQERHAQDRPTTIEPDAPESLPEGASEAAAARKVRAGRLEGEVKARKALALAEAYARESWREPSDTDAVLTSYMSVWNRHESTEAGKEARRRALAIKHKKAHPHPDRVLTSTDALQTAMRMWKDNRARVDALIEAHDYAGASRLVPASVADASGQFPREIDFWREHTRLLKEFKRELIRGIAALPLKGRLVDTPKGEGTVVRVTSRIFEIRLATRSVSLPWADLDPEAIGELASVSFAGEDARLILLQMAYLFAHKLGDSFWNMQLDLGSTRGAQAYARQSKAYSERFRAWSKANK